MPERIGTLDLLHEIADTAERYLEEGTNPIRNQLDDAVMRLRKLQKENREVAKYFKGVHPTGTAEGS